MRKMENNNYKIRRTYTNEKGNICCDYVGEWGESKTKSKQ